MSIPLLPGNPPELVVLDRPSRCPYLEGRIARLPLRLPVRELTPEEMDQRLVAGDRRQGVVLYRTACPSCQACEPIRVPVRELVLSRSQARTKQRGDRELSVEIGPPLVDSRRVELYNLHKQGRGLADDAKPIDPEDYAEFLVGTCCESFELRYHVGNELVGVAVTDRGKTGLSAVYCYFDPAYSALGIGTYSILRQVELCKEWELDWLYLGLYVADSPHMAYKARFLPHERLLEGKWQRFER